MMKKAGLLSLITVILFGFSSLTFGFMPPSWKSRQNVWKTLSNTGAPPSNIMQTRVARVGQKVYLWGGSISGAAISNGYVFNFATNTWSNMPTTGSPPAARFNHEMVVVGTKIIVWGGQTTSASASRLATGSYFDTVTQTWTAMSTVGAPSARAFLAMASTGSQVVIWGGGNTAGASLSDGKIYDPATNTWPTTITATGAPVARSFMSFNKVIWTGSKVFIWGGYTSGSACTNTGALYDPAANSWQSIPTSGAPAARCFNSAAWTGSKVIVWGGDTAAGGPAVVNTGGIYDPASNTWTGSTSTVGAPSARHWHAGVWTPAGMVIWGGTDGSGLTATGKFYDIVNDRWSNMSTTNSITGDGADVKLISLDHFLFGFDGTTVRAFFP